jgi:GrpB-like predicted nucleotidyltransferase (UPF0157 family)
VTSDGVPARAPVVIAAYDERWPLVFEGVRSQLEAALAGLPEGLVLAIEHAGSTAVPGLAAKPILDVVIGVRDWDEARATVEPITALGWTYRGEYGIPRRHYFVLRPPTEAVAPHVEACHLHMLEAAGVEYGRMLRFRDYLRAHPETARDYAALKRVLAARHGADREAYTEAKTAFVRRIDALAATEAGAATPPLDIG